MILLFRRLIMRLRRLPHSNGYGVHSPFAYDFLMQTAYERAPFYAFPALQRRYPVPLTPKGIRQLKFRKFLFRLANFVRPHAVRIYGTLTEAEHDYLLAACLRATITRETTPPHPSPASLPELLIIAPDTPAPLARSVAEKPPSPRSACLICGIYSSKQNLSVWHHASNAPAAAVTFDFPRFGLIFYDRSKPTQHYLVNF